MSLPSWMETVMGYDADAITMPLELAVAGSAVAGSPTLHDVRTWPLRTLALVFARVRADRWLRACERMERETAEAHRRWTRSTRGR